MIMATGTFAFAADVDDMTIDELKKAYQELEEVNKNLQAQLDEALGNNNSTTKSDSNTDSSPSANPDQPLYEQTDINCMIYGEGSERSFEMIVEVTNTSDVPLYLDGKSFDLEDKSGHLLQTDDMIVSAPDVIFPGEKGYFYNQFGSSIDVDTPNDEIVFIPNYKVTEARTKPHDYPVSDISFTSDDYGYTMVGRVENDTDEDFYVYANVIYYNVDGKCIGITGTNLVDVEPGDTQSFDISSMGIQDTFDQNAIDSYTLYMREPVYQF